MVTKYSGTTEMCKQIHFFVACIRIQIAVAVRGPAFCMISIHSLIRKVLINLLVQELFFFNFSAPCILNVNNT
jgi:hypothetical protein